MLNKTILVILSIIFTVLVGGPNNAWAKDNSDKDKFTEWAEKHNKPTKPAKLSKIQKAQMRANKRKAEEHEREVVAGIDIISLQPEWKRELSLSCPMGGYDQVVIYPELANQYYSWRGTGVKGFLYRRYVMVHRAKNPYTNMTLDITNGGQPVVGNMCPGGSITLVQAMPWLTPALLNGSYNQLRVEWTAEGMVDGRLAFGESSPGTLYSGTYNWEVVAMRPSWVMSLDRVDKKF